MTRVASALPTSCVLAAFLASTASSHAQTPPAADRLTAQPASLTLHGPRDRHRILVTTSGGDGRTTDLSATAVYASSRPDVVAVGPGGECRAVGDGVAEVTASAGGRTATVRITVEQAADPAPPSFLNDVTPLLTKLGCNQGSCHGKGAGQNGFRLSLRGYAPEKDFEYITREFDGRRLSRSNPAESLLLRKPLGLSPHEGGKLFGEGSRAHTLLLDWLRAGAPAPDATEPAVSRLEIFPGDRQGRIGDRQQLLVRAEYADGRVRDVTWLTKFDSGDPGIAEVDTAGLVTVKRQGETAVRGIFGGQVAVVIITAPFDRPVDPAALAGRNNFIDDHVFAKLGALRIPPSGPCTDEAFIRRAALDATGTLPTADEVRAFLADQRPDKRARLVDDLLGRPEFNDFWALQLGDLLQNRKERDHDVRGTKGVRAFHDWIRAQVAANRPWDQIARDVLTAKGSTTTNPAVGYYVVTVGEREAETSEVVASVAQAFLGTRIGCAQCHNHPLEKYTQDDYYHFAAFFSRVRLLRKDPKEGVTALAVGPRDPNQYGRPVGTGQPRTGQFMAPRPLDRSATTVKPYDDPREQLAAWMTDPANGYFSGSMVNRIWRHYLGAGLVEPVDDLRASNPPTNPGLWKALNAEFVTSKYDLRQLMRLVLTSRAYQLSASTTAGNTTDTRFYSHYYARRLPAEVLLDGLGRATGVTDHFPGYPRGVRAIQVPDPALKSYFLSLFGRSERVTACACERSGEVTMPQLLHLMNGDTVVSRVRDADGRLAQLLKSNQVEDRIVEELYLGTLSRLPGPDETVALRQARSGADRDEFFRDLFWALLNSKEFSFNH